jgi:hypothetical protein
VKIADGMEIPGSMRGSAQLIVECDGHDFHEKTKNKQKKIKAEIEYFNQWVTPFFILLALKFITIVLHAHSSVMIIYMKKFCKLDSN